MKNRFFVLLMTTVPGFFLGCGEGFLDIRRDKSQVVPSKVSDYQAILDNASDLMNNFASSHELGVVGADEFTVSDEHWEALTMPYQKNGYIWAKEVYERREVGDWNMAYRRILHANVVLDGVERIAPSQEEGEAWNNVKGSALFFRSFNFYQLAQLFCKDYQPATSRTDPGIPLRLEADINIVSKRASVEDTYQRILGDLVLSAELLPEVPLIKERPSKAAAFALLARVHLLMQNYQEAEHYAARCLQIRNALLDFNAMELDARYPFGPEPNNNPEIIFSSVMNSMSIIANARMNMSEDLLASYEDGDLRKAAYFFPNSDGRILFKGSYTGGSAPFTGLATDEIYLIRAECLVRTGRGQEAINVLNHLLRHRHKRDDFVPLSMADVGNLLDAVMDERRKELVMRGLRWEDLRRLNREPRYAHTLSRTIKGTQYELPPNSPKYIWPIPDKVIELSGIAQNIRD